MERDQNYIPSVFIFFFCRVYFISCSCILQKFRKAAGLQVMDEVTVMYTVTPQDHSLVDIILRHQEYIETASKTPIRDAWMIQKVKSL